MSEQTQQPTAYGFLLTEPRMNFSNVLGPYWLALVWGGVLLFFTNLLMALLPFLINKGVLLIEKKSPVLLQIFSFELTLTFFWLLGLIVTLAILGALLRTLSRKYLFDVGRLIERDLRARLFFHISTLDDGFFHKHSVGDVINHLTSDMSNIRMVTGFAALNLMNIIFVFLFTVPLLIKIDVILAACALLPFPLIIFTTSRISKHMFQATIDYQKSLSNLAAHVQENLLGAHIVRLFHQQARESERFVATNQNTFNAGVKLLRVRVLMLPLMRLMIGLAVGLILYLGGEAILSGRITLGDFVEINSRILQLSWPAMSVGFVMSVLSRGQASMTRINNLLAITPVIKDGEQRLTDVQNIHVENFSLRGDHQKQGLINIHIAKGEMLGVVGPSGSHKSTFLKALARRRVIPHGKIFFDGHDLNSLNLKDTYNLMAVVLEESFLFHKSIKDNICFARPDASDSEIADVLQLLRLDRDCQTFADGINTVIGERGITLSGGQRQRVALARAILAQKPILILDDALSAVDTETEKHILKYLPRFVKDSIIIIVTHRLSACRHADNIIVLDQGRVNAMGTHEYLVKHCALYQELLGFDQLQELWS